MGRSGFDRTATKNYEQTQNIRQVVIVRANYNVPACHAMRPRGALSFFEPQELIVPLPSPPGMAVSAGLGPVRQGKPPCPAGPGPGPHDVRPERGSSRAAETSGRRRSDATTSRRRRRCSRRLALVAAASASTGAITSAAAVSARGSRAGRRPGAGAGDHVTVTDSHHAALRTAPAASWRRQCPRDSCTCCQGPWLSPGRE